ncbi:MAG TPA: phosphate ABC transporter permease subunit PstC [Solirubrobacteraceae bacterium]
MTSATPAAVSLPTPLSPTRRLADRLGDRLLLGLTLLASLIAIAVLVLIVIKLVSGASSSVSKFGFGFLWHSTWNPADSPGVANANVFGAGTLIFGTAVTATVGLVLAAPLGIAIGIYLSLLAPGRAGAVIGPLVELLAAVPSVILGFWGLIFLGPFLRSTIEPALHSVLGFIPLFGAANTTGQGIFTTSVVLALMALPIIAAITRDIFLSVPRELKDGALALGATRWEMIRGVVLDSSRAGIAAAAILGLSRALGEAIAVTQTIGSGSLIGNSLFGNGDTLASRLAEQFPGTSSPQVAALFYCAVVLLVIELAVNFAAQLIVRRSARRQGLPAR